jgi:phosphatidylglycerophosphatase A
VKPGKRSAILFLVTAGGAGYVPRCPGTVGTLVAVPLSLGLNRIAEISIPVALGLMSGFIVAAAWFAGKAAEILRQDDAPQVVIDEIAGFLAANFLSEPHLGSMLAAFALFRFFDIFKLFPASRMELIGGGAGIVLDDVVAGLYTFAVLRLASWSGLL